jgi:hypothetical protein
VSHLDPHLGRTDHSQLAASNGKTDKRALEKLARSSEAVTQLPTPPPPVHVAKAEVPIEISTPGVGGSKNSSQTSVVSPPSSYHGGSSSTFNNATPTSVTPTSTLASLPLDEKEKIDPSSLEDQTHMWSGYKDDDLPEKTQGRLMRNLRHQIFYLYRRLFGIVFVTNLAIFVAVAVEGADAFQIGKIVVANLFVAILMRQDYVIDAFFTVFTSVPSS